jgi:hypothetical protein
MNIFQFAHTLQESILLRPERLFFGLLVMDH